MQALERSDLVVSSGNDRVLRRHLLLRSALPLLVPLELSGCLCSGHVADVTRSAAQSKAAFRGGEERRVQ